LRRELKLNSFKDIEDELDKIENAAELRTVGVWSVYQILQHMTDMLHGSMYGYPKLQLKIVRMTLGRFMYNKIINTGEMKPGYPNFSAPSKREEAPILPAIQRFRAMISEFKSYTGEMAIHPFFDHLNKEQWTQLHLIHFALHLSYITHLEKKSDSVEEKASPTLSEAAEEDGFLFEERNIQEQISSEKEESTSPPIAPEKVAEKVSITESSAKEEMQVQEEVVVFSPPKPSPKIKEVSNAEEGKTVSKKKEPLPKPVAKKKEPVSKPVAKKKEASPPAPVSKKKEPIAKKKAPIEKKKTTTKKK
jgi:hypothetical protein